MPSHNHVLLLGRLGAAPEVRTSEGKAAVLRLGLATHRRWRVGDDEWREETDWHKVVVFGPLAERLGLRAQKGDLLLVEGRLSRRAWKAADGTQRSTVEVVGQRVRVLGRLARERPGESLNGEAASGSIREDADVPF